MYHFLHLQICILFTHHQNYIILTFVIYVWYVSENAGGFFPSIKMEPEKYLIPLSDSVKQWLKTLHKEKKFLFLITSSYIDFAKFTMDFILG